MLPGSGVAIAAISSLRLSIRKSYHTVRMQLIGYPAKGPIQFLRRCILTHTEDFRIAIDEMTSQTEKSAAAIIGWTVTPWMLTSGR